MLKRVGIADRCRCWLVLFLVEGCWGVSAMRLSVVEVVQPFMEVLRVPERIRASLMEELASHAGASRRGLIMSAAFRSLVSWMEDAKVRAWPMHGEQRKRLRRCGDGVDRVSETQKEQNEWLSVFAEWLSEIECPYDVQSFSLDERVSDLKKKAEDGNTLLVWILSETLSIEYSDHKDDIDKMLLTSHGMRKRRRLGSRDGVEEGGSKSAVEDCSSRVFSEEWFKGIEGNSFAEKVKDISEIVFGSDFKNDDSNKANDALPSSSSLSLAPDVLTTQRAVTLQLQALVSHLRSTTAHSTEISPNGNDRTIENENEDSTMIMKDDEGNSNGAQERNAATLQLLRNFPVGLAPIDEAVDQNVNNFNPVLVDAARVLRLLYAADLRKLQSQVDEFIVEGQAITANPKIDSRLGKVGR